MNPDGTVPTSHPTLDEVIERAALGRFGGFLRCETCGLKTPLGDPELRVKQGWPHHCGHTMRWWTQRQIDAGEVPSR